MKKNIALDIDNTLFYGSSKEFKDSIKVYEDYYAIPRPCLNELFNYLDENKEIFNVIIYSAATKEHIDSLLKLVDTKNIIQQIYDRKYCDYNYENNKSFYTKNAHKLNIDFNNLYLIDDSPHHFSDYKIRGYVCKPFKGDIGSDFEIFNIIDFLDAVKHI